MPISIICQNKDPRPWLEAFNRLDPSLDVRLWPNDGDRGDVTFALTWQHPAGVLKAYPNLKTVSSMGAGVDHILQDKEFPPRAQLVRIVDSALADDMKDYLTMAVANYRHHTAYYAAQKAASHWSPRAPLLQSSVTVGVMGLGQIGGVVAQHFAESGYRVVGWSNSAKSIKGVDCLTGDGQLCEFLQQTNLLINLLPLTNATRSILNRNNLQQLKAPAFLINVGRGQHLVEADLLELLDNGSLAGACLDVFSEEPLPQTHPFWAHPQVTVTPHVSSLTRVESAVQQVLENYRRSQQQRELLNAVDIKRGY